MTDATAIPVNLYENERELMVVTPMPGVTAEEIGCEVTGDGRLVLRAAMRGAGQERIEYILREWSYGPFERTVELPCTVDATRANLSFGNGVLTIALPKAESTVAGPLRVTPTGHARGMTAGHAGGRGGAAAD